MPGKPLFIADFMLHKLCHWLRLLGINCLMLSQQVEDDELIKKAIAERAVLLTRDEALHQKARDYAKCALVPSSKLVEQVAFVVRQFNLEAKEFPSESLCPACGGKLRLAKKLEVKNKVFPRVYAKQKQFWVCTSENCGSIYWKGSHWEKIIETGARIGAALAKK